MPQIYGFQYYLSVQLPRKATYHFKGNAIKELSGTVYPSLTKYRDGERSYLGTAVHASGAIAPIAFRTCFGNFAGMTGKIHNNRKQTKHKGEKQQANSSTCDKHFSFRKVLVL